MPKEPFDPQQAAVIHQARENDPSKQAWLQALGAYKYLVKRARSRHNPDSLSERSLAERILSGQPLSFAAFYGVGGKINVDRYDYALLEELRQITQSAAAVISYAPSTQTTLLLADIHGEFNGFIDPQSGKSSDDSYDYLNQVANLAKEMGMQPLWLSQLYQQYGLTLPDLSQPIPEESRARRLVEGHRARGDHRAEQLIESARRHHQSGLDPYHIAKHYVAMRLQEAPMLEDLLPASILLVHGSKDLSQAVLPRNVPALFLDTRPAWFLNER
ncbi:MAG: hypothetical protein HYS86_05190 [Candidatus Chisholmbacteria bacterium]|nr:hypothetical protein [Candidatus Chisholmbacteria bacterium]